MCYAYRYTSLDLIFLIQGGLCSRGDESELQTNSCHGTNCYLVWDEFTKNAVCIDPGFAGRKIAMDIQKFGLKLKSIFITHSHADHVGNVESRRKRMAFSCDIKRLSMGGYGNRM